MPTMVKVNCTNCGKEYYKQLKYFNSIENRNQNHYCSIECQNEFKRIHTTNNVCLQCGKPVHKNASTIARSKSGNVFCSRSCASSYNNSKRLGTDNPGYKYGLGSYRSSAFRKNNHNCAICGWNEDKRILEVHHIDENRLNNIESNLIILCPICHKKLSLGHYVLVDGNTKLERIN